MTEEAQQKLREYKAQLDPHNWAHISDKEMKQNEILDYIIEILLGPESL